MGSNSRDVLLKLVKIAMGWDSDYTLPSVIDWSEVLERSNEQGVAAIVLDGYEIYLKNNPQEKSFLTIRENKHLRAEALGRLSTIEKSYQSHLKALSVLSDCFSEEKIPFMILKGFSCAQYYPIPEHRGCGDIDIYPGDLFSDSNNALRRMGIEVDMHYYRHSVSRINDVSIENHRVLCDLRGPEQQTRELEHQLEKLAEDSINTGDSVSIGNQLFPGIRFPSPSFNSLFLPWHVSAHFAFERVKVRHLLDWALFLIREGKNIDVSLFKEAKNKYTYGFSKFADILTNLSIRYLGIPLDGIPTEIIEDASRFDTILADRVFDYIFIGQPRERDDNVWKFRFNNLRRIWQERWKYRAIYDMNVFSFMFYKIKGVLFRVGENKG